MSKRNDLYCLCVELRGHSSWQDHWRRSRPGVIVYLFNWQNYQRPSPHAQAWRHCNTYQPQSRHSQGNEFFSPSLSWPWRKTCRNLEICAHAESALCGAWTYIHIQDRKCSTIQYNELQLTEQSAWRQKHYQYGAYARFSIDIVVRYTELSWNIFSDCFEWWSFGVW